MRAPRRTLLFHLEAIFYVNECELDFLQCSSQQRLDYIENLYSAVAREAVELGDYGGFSFKDLTNMFSMFHNHIQAELKKEGRHGPRESLEFWKRNNAVVTYASPLAFNELARSALSSQASPASAERLFSDLGRTVGRFCQSMLSSTVEMKAIIRAYVNLRLKDHFRPQNNTLHPDAAAFKSIVVEVAEKVFESEKDT